MKPEVHVGPVQFTGIYTEQEEIDEICGPGVIWVGDNTIPGGAHTVFWAGEWSKPHRWADSQLMINFARSCPLYCGNWERVQDCLYIQQIKATVDAVKKGLQPQWPSPPFPSLSVT
jgi:hypothetical protein